MTSGSMRGSVPDTRVSNGKDMNAMTPLAFPPEITWEETCDELHLLPTRRNSLAENRMQKRMELKK